MRIAFHVENPFHRGILSPVHELLRDEFSCLLSESARDIVAFDPRVIVVAGGGDVSLFRVALPEAVIVWTRHGYVSKNIRGISVERCDFACISSDHTEQEFLERGWHPRIGFWKTGFVPVDAMIHAVAEAPRDHLPPAFGDIGKVLLYAPTYTESLSSAEPLGPEWPALLRQRFPDLGVVIKPHPAQLHAAPHCLDWWRAAAADDALITLVDEKDADVYPLLAAADVLLSDASSVIFYYLALDRPIILFNNPKRFHDKTAYDPSGPEWTCRDMGIEIDAVTGLPEAVNRSLANPEARARQRAKYRQQVFGDTADGRAAERVADRIRRLLKPPAEDREWVAMAWNSHAAHRKTARLSLPWAAARLAARLHRYRRLRCCLGQLLLRLRGRNS